MKTTIIIFFIFISNLCGQSLKIYFGDRLYYQNSENIYKIKQLERASSFQGYDIIDSTHIFLAYENEKDAEASAYIAVYDISTGDEILIEELGLTGESFFLYNKQNDLVLFNWYDGLYTFKLHNSENQITLKPEKKRIIDCKECYLPFWVNSEMVGYMVFENEKWITKYMKLCK